ncbi:hypothetical protein D3C81_1662210 [compost metagenome]
MPVQSGHHNIEHRQIDMLRLDCLNGRSPVGNLDGMIALFFQMQPDQIGNFGIVIGDKNRYPFHFISAPVRVN